MSESVNWEAPPKAPGESMRARAHGIDDMVAELRKHPGKWAKVANGVKSNAGRASWIKRGCEATATRTADGVDIYARWPES